MKSSSSKGFRVDEFLRSSRIHFLIRRRVMDAQAKKKAMFRSKLNAKKKDARIDSPLVR